MPQGAIRDGGTHAAWWEKGNGHPSGGSVTPDGSLRGAIAVGAADLLLIEEVMGTLEVWLSGSCLSSAHEDVASIPRIEREE